MDPTTTCCPNLACPASGQTGQGNLRIHSCKDQRFLCTACHKPCSATQGTAVSRLRTAAETVSLVRTRMAHGGPRQAIVVAVWLGRAHRRALAGARWRPRPGGAGASGRATA